MNVNTILMVAMMAIMLLMWYDIVVTQGKVNSVMAQCKANNSAIGKIQSWQDEISNTEHWYIDVKGEM